MAKHLSKGQIARYLRRQSSFSDAADTEEHIAECPQCRTQILLVRDSSPSAQKGHGSEHLTYDVLEAYVDGILPMEGRDILLAHVTGCHMCADELQDLQDLRQQLLRPSRNPATTRQRVRPPRWISLTSGGIAATLTLVFLFAIFSKKTGVAPRETHERIPPALAAGGSIADEIATLTQGEQQAVLASLQQARITAPPVIVELRGHQQALRSKQEGETALAPLEPVGEVVADARPVFHWRPVKGAKRYSVVILDPQLNRVDASPALPETEWRPDRALQRGGVYQWVVKASMDNGAALIAPIPPHPEAKFKVLEPTRAEELNSFRETHANSHLVLGILYAQAGMLTRGEGEWRQISISSPDYELAQKLIKSIEEIRRPKYSDK